MATSLPKTIVLATDDKKLDLMFVRIQEVLDIISAKEIVDGHLLKDVDLVTGSVQKIPHGLARAITGYIIVKKSANCTIWDSESSNTMKTKFLNLNTSANVTVSIWVF